MKCVNENEYSKSYLIEHFDDLWILSKFITSGDIICSKTQRKVAFAASGDKKKQVTKIMYVEILVKKVELTHNTIRILGEILNENEFTKVGAHHSLTYEISDTVEFKLLSFENKRTKYVEKLFQDSLSNTKHKFIVVLCDVDSIVVAKCSAFSMDILVQKSRLGHKKYFSSSMQSSSTQHATEQMNSILNEELHLNEFNCIIFGGPGKYKEELKNIYQKEHSNQKIISVDVVDAQVSSISTVLEKITTNGQIEGLHQAEVNSKVDTFLELLHLGKNVSYGLEEVSEKIPQGACDFIIISSTMFDELQESNSEILYFAETLGSKLYVIESHTNKGKIVDGMGGILAKLRF